MGAMGAMASGAAAAVDASACAAVPLSDPDSVELFAFDFTGTT
jgi:hypothetical protein